MTTPLDAARKLHADGFAVIPVPHGSKNPNRKKWQQERWTVEDLPDKFNGKAQNIGVLCGEPSGGRTDVDLDSAEAVAAGESLLPPTQRIGGRTSRPRSHRWYIVDAPPNKATTQFIDPVRRAEVGDDDKAMLLEWRSTRGQTVVHGRHPEKLDEEYRWDSDGEPARLPAAELNRRVRHTAVAALLARYWPSKGARHQVAMPAAGLLANCNVAGEDAKAIVKAAATIAGDDEVDDRVEAVETTSERKKNGENYTGGTTLAKLLGEHGGLIVDRIQEWLLPTVASGGQRNATYGGGEAPAKGTDPDEAPARFKLTDLGNSERLVARWGADLRYVPQWGWMIYDGRQWLRDEGDVRVTRLAAETVRAIYQEAAAEEDADYRAALSKHATASERGARINAMTSLARADKRVEAASDLFDADPYLLACLNGTLDLAAGELRPHRREDYLTKAAPVEYNPSAPAPQWSAFLERIFDGDAALISYVQAAAGYTATGDTSERAVFIAHGAGANGKSTLLETMRAALGDYALRTPAETLLAKREGGVPSDVARLRGARLVTASETEDGRRLAEAFIKDLTGGDTLSTRFLYGSWFDFKPVCKVWLATNHKPAIQGTDNAIWDRIRLIPFAVSIPKPERDRQLSAKLRAELPGILAWIVRGALAWQQDGLQEPDAVQDATNAYREEQDVLGTFFAERCLISPQAMAPATQLYKSYQDWCEASGERPIPQRAFGMRLAERGFEQRKRTAGTRWWLGIGLLTTDPPPGERPSGGSGGSGPAGGKPPPKGAPPDFAESSATSATSATSTAPSDEGAVCARCGGSLTGVVVIEKGGRLYCDKHDIFEIGDDPPHTSTPKTPKPPESAASEPDEAVNTPSQSAEGAAGADAKTTSKPSDGLLPCTKCGRLVRASAPVRCFRCIIGGGA